ncbi:MAG TPA: hypothetical protein PKE39_05950 [Ignavibacteria bacterium]|nr:hypothetical protein [Ignavibacteria bacterium]HMQ98548.1 hypothetical protein [Ignavibacteria bacterium]
MKKLTSVLLLFITSFFIFTSLNGCGNDDIVTNDPVTATKGVFVLYEGSFGQPTSYDYAFINTDSNTVSTNVFQNSNSGLTLNAVPNGMQLVNGNLYVVSQGNFGSSGTIYKIDANTNQLIASKNFGTNPYSVTSEFGGNLFVTNTAGDYVTELDVNLNIVTDSIRVGNNPSEIVQYANYLYIAKQSYTTENSLAIIDRTNYQVSKIFFNTPPVCVETGENRVYISTYSGKKIYSIIQQFNTIGDSLEMNITEPAIGTIVLMDSHTLFVLGVSDTAFSSNVGKRVYKVDTQTRAIDPSFNIIQSGSDDIYGIIYDYIGQKLYVANSKSGTANGEIKVYDKNGNLLNTFADVGGKFPKRMAVKRS